MRKKALGVQTFEADGKLGRGDPGSHRKVGEDFIGGLERGGQPSETEEQKTKTKENTLTLYSITCEVISRNLSFIFDRLIIYKTTVSMVQWLVALSSSAVDRGFEPRSGQTRSNQILLN